MSLEGLTFRGKTDFFAKHLRTHIFEEDIGPDAEFDVMVLGRFIRNKTPLLHVVIRHGDVDFVRIVEEERLFADLSGKIIALPFALRTQQKPAPQVEAPLFERTADSLKTLLKNVKNQMPEDRTQGQFDTIKGSLVGLMGTSPLLNKAYALAHIGFISDMSDVSRFQLLEAIKFLIELCLKQAGVL